MSPTPPASLILSHLEYRAGFLYDEIKRRAMKREYRWIDLANRLKDRNLTDDTGVIIEGIKQTQKAGGTVALVACSRNHRDTLYMKLRLAGITPQTAVVLTIDDIVDGRLKSFRSRPLIIPRWTWGRIANKLIENPEGKVDTRGGEFTRL